MSRKEFSMMVFMILVLLHVCFITRVSSGSLYSLHTDSEYVLFMGPLKIGYRIPGDVSLPHAFIEVEYQGKTPDTSKRITTRSLSAGKTEGTVIVGCGTLEFAGNYTLKMYKWVNGKVLTQKRLKVVWPEIILSLPDNHEAQTQNVDLKVLSRAECPSRLNRFPMKIKLLFQRKISNVTGRILDLSPNGDELTEIDFPSSSLTEKYDSVKLPCHLFDLDGFYQTVIESAFTESPLVAKSNVMAVKWSKKYYLKHRSHSVFPCRQYVSIAYNHPSCSSVDKIRVYSLHLISEGSLAAPLERKLLMEQDAPPDKNTMTFQCGLFNKLNESASGFVFIYVSTTRNLEFYTEQTQLRISAWPDSDFPIDGGWGPWSSWSACSVSCGIGKRSRVRMCDSPAPKHGGMYCDGKPFQWMPCTLDCPDHTPVSPLQSRVLDPNCKCGCTKKELDGEIVATGRCNGSSVWLIETREEWTISLTFGFFGLNHSRQLVRVRDGPFPTSDLLFSSSDSGYPLEITSSGSVLRVEMTTTYPNPPPPFTTPPPGDKGAPQELMLPIHAQGFEARYKSIAAGGSGVTSPVLYPYHNDKTVMGSTVTIIGIVLCIIIILATVIFVILQRTFLQKKVKYRSAPISGSPSHPGLAMTQSDGHLSKQQHAHLTTSQISSSNASSPDGGTILVDMEKPLTGKNRNTKSDGSGKHENRNKKHHSNKSKLKASGINNKVKLFKPSTSGDSGSPKPSSREYASVKSGHGSEVADTDESSKSAPKSHQTHIQFKPKVPPANSSPIISKFDILKNKSKRKKSTSESSDTSVSQKTRSAVSTTKAEVNWPQSNFVKSAWNEMGKPFYDRHRPGQRPPSEEIPLIDTSSQESPSHVNNLVKSESTDSAASAFLPNRNSKVRRPTSLTESYSSVQSKCDELTITESPSGENVNETVIDCGTLKKVDTIRPRPTPTQTPSSSITPTSHLYNISSSIPKPSSPSTSSLVKTPKTPIPATSISILRTPTLNPSPIIRRPSAPSASSPSVNSPLKIVIPNNKKDIAENSPIPPLSGSSIDHQCKFSSPNPSVHSHYSPRLPRSNSLTQRLRNNAEAPSPSVLSKCSSRGSKTTISSPTRSITTPSEAEGLELEYDDFIDDDPLSFFDYEQTQKLAFRGSERIGKSPIDEDDEEDASGRH